MLACLFILRPIQLNKGFILFSEPFWTVGKYLQSRSKAEQLAGSDKRKYLPTSFQWYLSFI